MDSQAMEFLTLEVSHYLNCHFRHPMTQVLEGLIQRLELKTHQLLSRINFILPRQLSGDPKFDQ